MSVKNPLTCLNTIIRLALPESYRLLNQTDRLLIVRSYDKLVHPESILVLSQDNLQVLSHFELELTGEADGYLSMGDFTRWKGHEGLGAEAEFGLLTYLFDDLKLETVWGHIMFNNTASMALHRKMGWECRQEDDAGAQTWIITRARFESLRQDLLTRTDNPFRRRTR